MAKRLFLILIIGGLIWQNCATTNNKKDTAEYRDEIKQLSDRLKKNPADAAALRDIGIILYEIEQYPPARKYLLKSLKINPRDGKTLYYMGLTLEKEHNYKLALKTYRRYKRLPKDSSYREMMYGQYLLLTRKMIREEIRQRIAREEQLGASELSPRTVAVFPLAYLGKKEEYKPLGKGIGEMMITDLSQVHELTLVERIRLQTLMDEIALGQSGIIDEATAPRFGKLLRAGTIIHGTYDVQKKKRLKLDVGIWDVLDNNFPDFASKNDVLNNLFKLEKDLVFNLITEMGIELTPAEKTRIQHIPTQNMQAFLAYCMGLEMEDSGNYEAAAQYYRKAVSYDPGFKMAAKKANASSSMSYVSNQKRNALAANRRPGRLHAPPAARSQRNLMNNRLQNISNNIGATFIPGQDTREAAEEATQSGAEVFDDLPLPPQPPRLK